MFPSLVVSQQNTRRKQAHPKCLETEKQMKKTTTILHLKIHVLIFKLISGVFRLTQGSHLPSVPCSQTGVDSNSFLPWENFFCFLLFLVTQRAVLYPSPLHKATHTLPESFPQFLQWSDPLPGFVSISFLFIHSSLFCNTCFYPYNKLISSAISQSYITVRH